MVGCDCVCVLVGERKTVHAGGETEEALCRAYCTLQIQNEEEFVCEGWDFGQLASDKIS